MRIIRVVLPWVVLAVVAFLGYRYVWPLFLPVEPEMDVQTTVVQRGDLRRIVPADGLLRPAVLVEVKSKAAGVVESISVEPGDTVAAGDVLVELDKEQVQASLRQAEASLLSAKAQLEKVKRNLSPQQLASQQSAVRQAKINYENAKGDYERIADLHDKGYATDDELNNAEQARDTAKENLDEAQKQLDLDLAGGEEEDIAVAEANVAIRQAELDDVNEEFANTTVRAPIAGKVLTRPVEIGTAVSSGTAGNTGGTVVATIGDMSTLYIEARIDETDLGRVFVEMPCRVTFDAYQGEVWSGKLAKIYPQGEETSGGATRFPVDVELSSEKPTSEGRGAGGEGQGGGRSMRGGGPPGGGTRGGRGPGGGGPGRGTRGGGPAAAEEAGGEAPASQPAPELRPNMTANVEFVIDDHPDVLILAARFVQYDDNRQPYCEVLPDPEDQKTRERRELKLGFSDGMRFEITDGLQEGETVILERPVVQEGNSF